MNISAFRACLLALCLALYAGQAVCADSGENSLDLNHLPQVPDVDLLGLNEQTRHWLTQSVRYEPDPRARAYLLHDLLFRPQYRGIEYDDRTTYTAQQTFDKRVGNCISHASLYVAAARHLGLKARFQWVQVPRDWVREKNYYVVPGHINVAVLLPGNTITVEFTSVYSAQQTQHFKSKSVSDTRALAEYYNNKGMEAMATDNTALAVAFIQKSIATYKKISYAWSNLGVIYKMNGYWDLAQQAYEQGLRIDKRNLSIINNAYILYNQTGQLAKAEKLERKVLRYSKKNPYYLQKLAEADEKLNNIEGAMAKMKKAVALKPEEARFHLHLARLYAHTGDAHRALKQLELGLESAQDAASRQRFEHKLSLLKNYQAALIPPQSR